YEHFLELFFGHAALLCANLLNVEAENSGPFRQVINVAAGFEELQHIPLFDGAALFVVEVEFIAIAIFILTERLTVFAGVEGEAHFVECIASYRLPAVEYNRARDTVVLFAVQSHWMCLLVCDGYCNARSRAVCVITHQVAVVVRSYD